jgi:hypothetical protein
MLRYLMASLALALTVTAGAAHADAFDARRAPDIAALITSHGASGALKKGGDSKIYFEGQVGNVKFEAHFQSCNDARTLCKTVLLGGAWTSKKITVDQINRWNRWTLYCPSYLDSDNSPNVWYSIAVSGNTADADLADDLGTWMDCLHDFDGFVDDPEAFLAKHS